MNLHGIASKAIAKVNPFTPAKILRSDGYETGRDYVQRPKYAVPLLVSVQLQPPGQDDLVHVSGLNLQGIIMAAYVNGNFNGVNRLYGGGGDIIEIKRERWLIVQVLEWWPDWCKFIINLQETYDA